MSDTTSQLDSNGRDAGGRFAKGNPGGPGRRPVLKEIAYLREIKTRVDPSDVAEVFEKVLELAKSGDLAACKIVFQHLLPQPLQRVSVDDQFFDPHQSTAVGEFRRAGANWKQIDQEFLEHLSNLIAEQAVYEDQVAEYHAKLKAQ